MTNDYDLDRFVEAQDAHGIYSGALAEIRSGRKVSHWMWFVFPQIAGLGQSPTAKTYAISSLAEAQAYLEHPVLGPRLLQITSALRDLSGRSATEIFGSTDAMKLRSSMTLFTRAAPDEPLFGQILEQYFGGEADAETDRRL